MVALAYYLEIVVIIATLVAGIRWRGFFSYEGIGFFCCLVMVATDGLGIAAASLIGTEISGLQAEIANRLYPGVVFELGILVFLGGLAIAELRPRPVMVPIQQPEDRRTFVVAALGVILLGLTFKTVAMVSYGVSSIGDYLINLGGYTTGQRGLGGFLDLGLPLAIVGLAMLGAAARNLAVSVGLFLLGALLSFLLSYSRAELFGTMFLFFVMFGITRPDIVRLAKRHIVITSMLAATIASGIILNSGVKSAMRAGQDVRGFSIAEIGTLGVDRWLDRFSGEGVYDGYCNFVNRLSQSPERFWRGDVAVYAVVSTVPHFLFPTKPAHPFRDTGYLVYDDMRSSVEDVCATTVVGSAYADFGLVSVVFYLGIYGVVIGMLRRVLLKRGTFSRLLYVNLIIIEGSTNFIHTGVLAFIPSLALNVVVVLMIYAVCRMLPVQRIVPVLEMRSRPRPAIAPSGVPHLAPGGRPPLATAKSQPDVAGLRRRRFRS